MKEKLISIIENENYTPMKARDFSYLMGITDDENKSLLQSTLSDLENEGVVVKNSKGKYVKVNASDITRSGTFRKGNGNFGFVVLDKPEDMGDIFISPKNMYSVQDGDKVIVNIITKAYGDKKAEGKIIRITERADKSIPGIIRRGRKGSLFADCAAEGTFDLVNTMGAKYNDVVLIKNLGKIDKNSRRDYAKVVRVIGNIRDKDINIKMAMAKYEIEDIFDSEVISYSKFLTERITSGDLSSRRDLRDRNIFTIDGETAKDLDDAVGIEYDGEIFTLTVSIADVSYFVREGDVIDKCAYERGTSVYFPGRAVHMLPGELCENLCSLAPDVDRLAFSVEMQIDRKGKVLSADFYKSIIRSRGKLTYENVNLLFDGDKKLPEIYYELGADLNIMKTLWKILDEKRNKRGSIEIDLPESEVYIEDGKIQDIFIRERGTAEKIIEEFMLITNTTVAEFIASSSVASLYRSHEDPDKEKLDEFRSQMAHMGHSLRLKDEYYSSILNKFLSEIRGDEDEFIIRKMLLRCMKKACYSVENKSHFALGYEYYTHFTSPIRRYPDLVVHRVLGKIISGELTKEDMDHLTETLPEVASHTSKRERIAEEAERYCDKLYMSDFVEEYRDEVFTGIISGVIRSGFFVQLGNLIEGFVPLSLMEDDYYEADPVTLKVVGRRHGDVYSLGDVVDVACVRTDKLTGEIDFVLV